MTHRSVWLLLAVAGSAQAADEVLETIVIEADAEAGAETPVSPAEIPLGISVSGDEFAAVPGAGNDVLRAVSSLPGVAVNGDNEAEVAVRGSRPENNRYYVDFLPTGYLFHFAGISVIDSELVKRFDFLPAGYGAEFQGGMGAVLDIETRAPKKEREALLDISLLDAGLLLEGEVKPGHNAYLSARMSYYDLLLKSVIEDNEDDEFGIVQLPKYWDYRAKYRQPLAAGKTLDWFIDGADDEAEFVIKDGSDTALQDPLLVGSVGLDFNYHRQGLLLNGERDNGSRYKLGLVNRLSSTGIVQGQAADVALDINTLAVRGEYSPFSTSAHQWRVGGSIDYTQADYSASSYETFCTEFDTDCRVSDAELISASGSLGVSQVSAYVEDDWILGDHALVTAGLGVNGDDYLDTVNLEPRLRYQYLLDRGVQLSAAIGRYYEFPEFAQVESTFGNPELDYLESDHYVLAIEHERDDGWYWKTEAYYKQMRKLVTSDSESNYLNQGEGESQGVELFVKKAFDQRWSGWLSLSWSEAARRDQRTGERFDFEYDQPLIASLVARYQLNPRWALSSKVKFNSGAPYTPVIGAEEDVDNAGSWRAIYGDLNSERLPDYFRVDVRADYQPQPDGWRVYGELLNATAHKNISGYDYNADYSERDAVESLPLFLNVGLQWPFR